MGAYMMVCTARYILFTCLLSNGLSVAQFAHSCSPIIETEVSINSDQVIFAVLFIQNFNLAAPAVVSD